MKGHTFDMSQAITEGSFETRSKENTLFFTFFARRASPVFQKEKDSQQLSIASQQKWQWLLKIEDGFSRRRSVPTK